MPARSAGPSSPAIDSSAGTARALRKRSTVNLLRMGHCAPTVIKTLLDASGTDAPWLVRLAAGLPGGIGNTGGECGGVTAPLILLGLRYGLDPDDDGLPLIFSKGHDLLARFSALEGTTLCREIRGHARVPLRCIRVIREAPALCARSLCSECRHSVSAQQRKAYGRLYSHRAAKDFHCAHSVFRHLGNALRVNDQVLAASSAFLGGTLFTGKTCSALTAGVLALGLKLGEIENSRLRVLRMIMTMAVGGNAFEDKVNAFNKIMNLGHGLARWFAIEFGSTQCCAITQSGFSTTSGVQSYLDGGRIAVCREIAYSVARKVASIVGSAGPIRPRARAADR